MAVVKVQLGLELPDGWVAAEGLLGGPGPLASVVFRKNGEQDHVVGIDLDKPLFLVHPPVTVNLTALFQIVHVMNAQRRQMPLPSPSVVPPSA